MEVRPATFADIPAMIEVGKRVHEESAASHLKFDEQGAKLAAAYCLTTKDRCAFVAEDAGAIAGLLLGQEQPFGYLKARYATDIVTAAVKPGAGRKLLARFVRWALEERKVDQVILGVTYGGRSLDAAPIYRRLGAKDVGGIFIIDRSRP